MITFSIVDGDETVAIFIADGTSGQTITIDIAKGLYGLEKYVADSRAAA